MLFRSLAPTLIGAGHDIEQPEVLEEKSAEKDTPCRPDGLGAPSKDRYDFSSYRQHIPTNMY